MTSRIIQAFAFALLSIVATGQAFAEASENHAITVAHPWARATPPIEPVNAAAYMIINNQSDKDIRVTGVSTPIAQTASLHQSLTVDGQMRMRALPDGLAVPAGGSVKLEPKGYHVMMMSLDEPLKVGDSFPVTLTFADSESAGASIVVDVQVRDERPASHSSH
ncbi:MAG: copper chaperone PCu(A)C [Oleiphilaceae bacterium]|nr:copper chaperone PCu(A)C [Oleiphilaceae bacterium]